MDFDLPPEEHPTRQLVRDWVAANPAPSGSDLAEAGYVVPHWPRPWGLDADPVEQLVIDDELSRAGVRCPGNQIGIGWAAPTILLAGTPEQHDRYLPKIFSGEEFWCQLFSETEAGSDLANLATSAVRDGDEYVVNGSKIWSSGAHHAQFGILIARTDPDVPKHRGGLVLHHADGCRGPVDEPDRRHDHGALVQPGLLRRRPHPCGEPRRAPKATVGDWRR